MNSVAKFIEENFAKTIRLNKEDDDTLIGLPCPYTVPCIDDMFQEMYYWDTYFTNVGLLVAGNVAQAKNNADNMFYLIEKYGFMPNGNRTYYLKQSQPPFLFLMVRDIFRYEKDIQWLKKAYDILEKEYEFWQTKRIAPNGLNYYGNQQNVDEQEIFWLCEDFTKRSGGCIAESDAEQEMIARTVRTFCESGWDCTSRFEKVGHHYNPVDLNSLLYGFECCMEEFSDILSNGMSLQWKERAEGRKLRMRQFLWNEQKQIYMDWNFEEKYFSPVCSAASLYPLCFEMCESIKGEKELLHKLLLKYGISATEPDNYIWKLQWDYPNVWAPLQYMAFWACQNYGYEEMAREIATRYTRLIEQGYEETGNLWEKYDGNTGVVANQDYQAPAMMGWTAGIYIYFKNYLDGQTFKL